MHPPFGKAKQEKNFSLEYIFSIFWRDGVSLKKPIS